jgi:hypothetical protein
MWNKYVSSMLYDLRKLDLSRPRYFIPIASRGLRYIKAV